MIVRLRQRAIRCNFQNADEEIRDQVIEKCKSHKIRSKLLIRGQELTLDDLRTIAATVELTDKQTRRMDAGAHESQAHGASASVNAVQHGTRTARPGTHTHQHGKCFRCGRSGHFAKDGNCPAKNKECNKCGLLGLFASCCKTKRGPNKRNEGREQDKSSGQRKTTGAGQRKPSRKQGRDTSRVNTVNTEHDSDSDSDYAFHVGSLGVNRVNCSSTDKRVYLGKQKLPINVIVDSGASVNIIDAKLWESLKKQKITCKSEITTKKLYAYGTDKPLDLLGKFSTVIAVQGDCKSREVYADFYVLKGAGPALLGRETAEQLGILSIEVNYVDDVRTEYKECFEGIGKLEGYQLSLHVDRDVEPVAQRMYRIPYSMRQKVSDKLDELESLDIIEKVQKPTSYVSPVIVVPKPSGDIRLCVDMRQANKAIIRERHPIPTVDEILYNMNGAEVFSKLDLKYGYHQIELDDESRDITTFVTHKGLYRYKRLMFGISAAPEKYQQVIAQVFNDCDGVQNISDDIVVYGRDKQEHDQRLKRVMERLKEVGLTLNPDKCEFAMQKITFMGHVLSHRGI